MAAMFSSQVMSQDEQGDETQSPVELKPMATITEAPDPETLVAKSSFIVGFNYASQVLQSMQQQGIEIDMEQFLKGVQTAVAGEDPGMSPDEIRSVMMAFQKQVEQQQIAKMTAAADANRKAGDEYRANNAKKEGVEELPSGVQYEVLKEGDGELPTADDTVLVEYTGMFIDGREFDSSLKPRGGMEPEPVPMPVSAEGLIKGFGEVFPLMKVGSKWRVTIPPESAYQVRGRGPIGPNETLVFEIEVHEIMDEAPGAAADE